MTPHPAAGGRRLTAALLGAALLLSGCLAGCAQSVDPIERLGKKAAQGVGPHASAGRPAYRRWGLDAPLPAAPTPAGRRKADRSSEGPAGAPSTRTPATPSAQAQAQGHGEGGAAAGAAEGGRTRTPGRPPVLEHIDTTDKVVFLTYDDGAERDPRFVDMVRELRLPVSLFLTDRVVGPGYGRFAALRSVGAGIQNHTLDHPALRGLPYPGQRAEICGQQEKLRSRFGLRPTLLRPPYGIYDDTTLRAAADCGISAVVLWRASMGAGELSYAHGEHRLRPGDIVTVDPGESIAEPLTRRTTRLLRAVQEQGLTVGRLEDYLKAPPR